MSEILAIGCNRSVLVDWYFTPSSCLAFFMIKRNLQCDFSFHPLITNKELAKIFTNKIIKTFNSTFPVTVTHIFTNTYINESIQTLTETPLSPLP